MSKVTEYPYELYARGKTRENFLERLAALLLDELGAAKDHSKGDCECL